jgi:hypothetical protein
VDDGRAPTMSWPIAATLVIGMVLLILVGGVFVARRVQSNDATQVASTTPQPTSVRATAAATAPTFVATPQATAAPTPRVATLVTTRVQGNTPVAAATPAVQGTSGAAAVATPAPTQVVAFSVVMANGTPQVVAGGAAVATPTEWWNQSNAISPQLADELNAAYQRFWQVRAQALLDLDPSALPGVMDGAALQREQANLDSLRAQNHGEQIDVQHRIQIMHATPDDATIFDNYTSRVVPVDLTTNEPQASGPSRSWFLAYHFLKFSGNWKVVEAIQIDT